MNKVEYPSWSRPVMDNQEPAQTFTSADRIRQLNEIDKAGFPAKSTKQPD